MPGCDISSSARAAHPFALGEAHGAHHQPEYQQRVAHANAHLQHVAPGRARTDKRHLKRVVKNWQKPPYAGFGEGVGQQVRGVAGARIQGLILAPSLDAG